MIVWSPIVPLKPAKGHHAIDESHLGTRPQSVDITSTGDKATGCGYDIYRGNVIVLYFVVRLFC